jgi:hypothetical protein
VGHRGRRPAGGPRPRRSGGHARLDQVTQVIAVDTNLLVYAHRAATREHRRARAAIALAAGSGAGWGIAPLQSPSSSRWSRTRWRRPPIDRRGDCRVPA